LLLCTLFSLFSSFSFYCSFLFFYLHSFPTRRSSDLFLYFIIYIFIFILIILPLIIYPICLFKFNTDKTIGFYYMVEAIIIFLLISFGHIYYYFIYDIDLFS